MKIRIHLQKILLLTGLVALTLPADLRSQFRYPVSGTVPNGGHFGACRDGCSRQHLGLDISGPTNTLVGAGYGGTVAFSGISCGLSCGYGRVVYINHSANYQTRYAHNDVNLVSVGQNVSQNQNIARRGNTGSSTGPHVHYEIRRHGTALHIPGSPGTSITRNTLVPANYPGLEPPPPPPVPPTGGIIVDNSDSGFTASSAWFTATWADDKFGADYRGRNTEAVSDPATWSFTVNTRGNYEVFAWWTAGPNRATSASYLIDHANGTTTVNANQTQNGGKWNSLGTFLFGGSGPTSHSVRLSCWTSSGDIVIADAIRLVPRSIWVDNHHTGFNASSNWGTATWASDKFGPDYRFRDTEPISDQATWTVQHLAAGSHRVDAWWTAASNRATAAAYHVHRSDGTTTVNVNQTQNGGKWNSLGTFNLVQGTNSVQLSCWTSSGDIVIADAVRWVLP